MHLWNEGENVMAEHSKVFTFCHFVKGIKCGNREYRSDRLTNKELANITVYLHRNEEESTENGGYNSAPLGISTNRAGTIRYAPESRRIQSFARWSVNANIILQGYVRLDSILPDILMKFDAFIAQG